MAERLHMLKIRKPTTARTVGGKKLHRVPEGKYTKEKPEGPEYGALTVTMDPTGRRIAVYEEWIAYEMPRVAGAKETRWMKVDKRDWWIVEQLLKKGKCLRPWGSHVHPRIGYRMLNHNYNFLDSRIVRQYLGRLSSLRTVGYANGNFYDLRLANLEIRNKAEYLWECSRSMNTEIAEAAKKKLRVQARLTLENKETAEDVLAIAEDLGKELKKALANRPKVQTQRVEQVRALRDVQILLAKAQPVQPLLPATIPDAPVVPVEKLRNQESATLLAPSRGMPLNPEHRSYVDDRPTRAEDHSKRTDRSGVKKLG
jgi:hypothetical protein